MVQDVDTIQGRRIVVDKKLLIEICSRVLGMRNFFIIQRKKKINKKFTMSRINLQLG